jgi:hypothetical protein
MLKSDIDRMTLRSGRSIAKRQFEAAVKPPSLDSEEKYQINDEDPYTQVAKKLKLVEEQFEKMTERRKQHNDRSPLSILEDGKTYNEVTRLYTDITKSLDKLRESIAAPETNITLKFRITLQDRDEDAAANYETHPGASELDNWYYE